MRLAWHVWLFLTLSGCGSITLLPADADGGPAAPGPAARGPFGSGGIALDAGAVPMTATPAPCDKSRSKGNEPGTGADTCVKGMASYNKGGQD